MKMSLLASMMMMGVIIVFLPSGSQGLLKCYVHEPCKKASCVKGDPKDCDKGQNCLYEEVGTNVARSCGTIDDAKIETCQNIFKGYKKAADAQDKEVERVGQHGHGWDGVQYYCAMCHKELGNEAYHIVGNKYKCQSPSPASLLQPSASKTMMMMMTMVVTSAAFLLDYCRLSDFSSTPTLTQDSNSKRLNQV